MKLSIIIPSLNEAGNIVTSLEPLQRLRSNNHEIILVDGGSSDNTVELAHPLATKIVYSRKGRARQMNTGAEEAFGDVFWFLHADTIVPENADQLIEQALNDKYWGRFNIRLSGKSFLFRIIERMVNVRSCFTGIATGDQGIFIKREAFNKINAYPDIPLMEDIEISKRLRRIYGRPACVSEKLLTSSRRWEKHGIFKTVFLMWWLRLSYFFGISAEKISRAYKDN